MVAHNADCERALGRALEEIPFSGVTRSQAWIVLRALEREGWRLIRADSWRLRSDFDVVPHSDGSVTPETSIDSPQT